MKKDDSSLNSSVNTGNDTSLDESSVSNNLNNNGTLDELEKYLVVDGNEADNDNSDVEEGRGSENVRDRKSKRSGLKVKLNAKPKVKKSGKDQHRQKSSKEVEESEKLPDMPENGESDRHITEDLLSDIFDNPSPMNGSDQDQNSSRDILCKKTSRRTTKRKKSSWKKLVVEKRMLMSEESGEEDDFVDDTRGRKSSKRKKENVKADKERKSKKRKESKSQITRKVVIVNNDPIIIPDNDDIHFGPIVISDDDSEDDTSPTAKGGDQSGESGLKRNSVKSMETKLKETLAKLSDRFKDDACTNIIGDEVRQDDAPSTSGNTATQNGAGRDAGGSQEDWVVINNTTADETIDDDPRVREVSRRQKTVSPSKKNGKFISSQNLCTFELVNLISQLTVKCVKNHSSRK